LKNLYCFANNKIELLENAGVPVVDLMVQRGYGIFDFLRVQDNKPLFIEAHLNRFFNSAAIMRLHIKETRQQVKALVYQIIEKNNIPNAGIRLLIGGGDAPDGYTISAPHLIIIQQPLAAPSDNLDDKGIHLVSYNYKRQLAEVKTTDYLMAIWLQPWMKSLGGDDILYHHEGFITECPRSNIFIVTADNVLVTPSLGMLKGITRNNILSIAAENNIPFEERPVHLDEFATAKESFITSSTKRMTLVRQMDSFLLDTKSHNSLGRITFDLLLKKERFFSNL
jgi:D-alanine transaminase/branched-chain amino acid aminotransferase